MIWEIVIKAIYYKRRHFKKDIKKSWNNIKENIWKIYKNLKEDI